MKTQPRLLLLGTTVTAGLAAQSHLVVPSTFATTDAMSYEWIAGATDPQRQQTLIGASHLAAMLGSDIHAIEFRRTAVNETYAAGSTNLTVTLSISPNTPLACSNSFAANTGPSPVQVFSGTVTLPASPATGGSGSAIGWTAANIVRIPFTQPFHYAGGTICVDVTGQPITGQETWWMADATEEVIPGTAVVELGPGCGGYGGVQRQWSSVDERSLVPGGHAVFRAWGTPSGLAVAMFGAEATGPLFPQYPLLGQWGIPTPNCVSYLNPLSILATVPTVFDAPAQPSPFSSMAEVLVPLPSHPAWFGFQLTTQWFDLGELASSNGLRWTVGSAAPTLDMALCEGVPQLPSGHVTTYLAHVLRFEYQ
ncbi:MAG: hypothetical protein KDC98_25300 [Planctomycetes bacterium]|nr:hypothetical protein [Planctomycetota bacterium]